MARKPNEKLLTKIPDKYDPQFIENLDGRTTLARIIPARRSAIEADMGGADALSYARRSLVKRVVWLECVVETYEQTLAKGGECDLGAYTQAINSLLGLFRLLGLERKQKTVRRLHEHPGSKA